MRLQLTTFQNNSYNKLIGLGQRVQRIWVIAKPRRRSHVKSSSSYIETEFIEERPSE